MVTTRAAKKRRTSNSFDGVVDTGILRSIMSFAGPNQYRFLAGVNKSFKEAYELAFPLCKITFLNARTLDHAKICYQEMDTTNDKNHAALVRSAGKHGNIQSIEYLRSVATAKIMNAYSHTKNSHYVVASVEHWQNGPQRQRDLAIVVCAAIHGHLHVLKWAQANQILTWHHHKYVSLVAERGHLDILKWAHKNWGGERYDWLIVRNSEPCKSAAGAGHLDVLIWLRKKGYPLSTFVYEMAQRNGQVHVLKWLRSNGCPVDSDSDDDTDSDDSLD